MFHLRASTGNCFKLGNSNGVDTNFQKGSQKHLLRVLKKREIFSKFNATGIFPDVKQSAFIYCLTF